MTLADLLIALLAYVIVFGGGALMSWAILKFGPKESE